MKDGDFMHVSFFWKQQLWTVWRRSSIVVFSFMMGKPTKDMSTHMNTCQLRTRVWFNFVRVLIAIAVPAAQMLAEVLSSFGCLTFAPS